MDPTGMLLGHRQATIEAWLEHRRDPIGTAQGSKGYPIFVSIIFVLIGSVMALIIAMGVHRSVKYLCRRNNDGTTNEVHTRIELESLQVNHGSEANKHGQGGYSNIYERYTQMMKKLSGMRNKKKGYFFTPNISEENEIQEHDAHGSSESDDDGSSESDDDAVRQLFAERLRPPRRSRRPSASSSSRSSHVSQLTRELDEYKRRCEETEREVHRQQEKISSVHREMQEEVNSIKRQQTQRQQEMEANQRQMEQQIQFLTSQLQLRRDLLHNFFFFFLVLMN
ncbi:hypothetical protein FH972_016419 [Carpinus fangiana]|uniref:Uncharacterized protein n=1 Tax=Carpinus fangiana TaxID=176857 RepID=A0A5N6RJM5_9ROSI|nr:hypothetical protein FH972_016419 [Carpinus fangiana]